MKKICFSAFAVLTSLAGFAQQTRYYTDPLFAEKFKEAKEYFQKEHYSLAPAAERTAAIPVAHRPG